jgi:tetratricopeptide (TPR) repeat protein
MNQNDASYDLEKLIQAGKSALDINNYLQSEAIWREIIKIEPNHIDAHYYLGKVLYNLGKLEESITAYHQTIKLNSKDVDAYSMLGFLLCSQGKYEEAIINYRHAIKLEPKNANFYESLGYALFRLDKFEEAASAYRKTLELDSNNIDAYKVLGNLAYQQKKYKEAINIYYQGIERDPKNADFYYSLGKALDASGKYQKAILAYFHALQLNPKYIFKYRYCLLSIIGWFMMINYYLTHPLDFSWFWTFAYIGIQLSPSIILLTLEFYDFFQQKRINLSFNSQAINKIKNNSISNKLSTETKAFFDSIDRHLISTLLLLPGEDGLFRVPILLLGTNWLNSTIFGIIFGFCHIGNRSALKCLGTSIMITIANLVVLPHSLLSCIIGHVISDLIGIKFVKYLYNLD